MNAEAVEEQDLLVTFVGVEYADTIFSLLGFDLEKVGVFAVAFGFEGEVGHVVFGDVANPVDFGQFSLAFFLLFVKFDNLDEGCGVGFVVLAFDYQVDWFFFVDLRGRLASLDGDLLVDVAEAGDDSGCGTGSLDLDVAFLCFCGHCVAIHSKDNNFSDPFGFEVLCAANKAKSRHDKE